MTITVELDAKSEEILNRLRGDLTPSAFFQVLLQMVDSGAVGSPPERTGPDLQQTDGGVA